MRDEIVAKRYADAFLAHAKENIGFERALEELHAVRRILTDNPDLLDFLERLDITNTEKAGIIDVVVADHFSEEIRNFLKLLLDASRIDSFMDIAEYARVAYSHGIELEALLKTSYPLDTDVIEKLKNALEVKLKRKLHMYVELDPTLLGGVYAKIGNVVIDGSVKKRLEDLREKLHVLKVA